LKNGFGLILVLLFSYELAAQEATKRDTLEVGKTPIILTDSTVAFGEDSLKKVKSNGAGKFMPVPKRATRLALIPGGGQIYNRDYWKLPIVYVAFGGGLYAYYLNSLKYRDYLNAYKSFYDLDKDSKNYGKERPEMVDSTVLVRVRNLLNTNSEYLPARRDQAARGKNYWRRNRGFSLIVTGLIYSLSIIEANVAAHLKTFDLSDDLTLRIEPKLQQPAMRTPAPGVRLVFNLK
jgi:hypothetical protein